MRPDLLHRHRRLRDAGFTVFASRSRRRHGQRTSCEYQGSQMFAHVVFPRTTHTTSNINLGASKNTRLAWENGNRLPIFLRGLDTRRPVEVRVLNGVGSRMLTSPITVAT